MFILPIGHEDLSVRRLPWVTIGIALACTIIQFHACDVEEKISGSIDEISSEMGVLVTEVARECSRRRDCDIPRSSSATDFVEALRARTIGSPEDQDKFAALDRRLEETLSGHPVKRLGYRPDKFSATRIVTYMFAHGGWMHLIGNMLFLYLTGLAIEERWGRWRFLLFYLLGGVAAALTYGAFHQGSSMPLVGASGAIAAAMGAFVVLFARTKIKFFYFIWFFFLRTGTFSAPAWLVLPLWFLEQLVSISAEASGLDHVGYSAHAGGFAFGAAVALVIRFAGLDKKFKEDTDVASGGWVQDPLLAAAAALAEKGDARAALAKLSELLTRDPKNSAARELALDLASQTNNPRLMQRHAAQLFPEWVRNTPPRVVETYHRIAELSTEDPIDERILDFVLTAAAATHDLELAQEVMRRFFRHFPQSLRIPRSLWVMAELQGTRGRNDLEASLLERLTRDYPTDPWAERARQRLATLGAA